MKKITKYFSINNYVLSLISLVIINIFYIGIFFPLLDISLLSLKQSIGSLLYWLFMALVITMLIGYSTVSTYEEPMLNIYKAINDVSNGDFSVYVEPIHNADRYDHLDYMIQDFNKMVEELGSVETLKNDFVANVSHEIKTPLAIIQSYSELLESDELPDYKRKEYAKVINDSTKRLSIMITNILKLNKLEKQNIDCNYENYDLCEQLCNCMLAYEELWDKKNIEIELDIEDERIVELDQELMEIVWNNLIANAIKFTEEGGSIKVKEYINDDECIVEINDTGCGMSDETIKHIFDKFYQGDTSHAMQGNGLGLALVSKILQLMNGDINVVSELNVGSTFIISVPNERSNES